jgi:hypothetical protein
MLISTLSQEFNFNALDVQVGKDEIIFDDAFIAHPESDASVKHALQELHSSPRQEKRLAIIFDLLLSDPLAGIVLLERYKNENASFAGAVVQRLKQKLRRDPTGYAWEPDLYGEIYRVLIDFYGLRKGLLLLEFATRLGRYPEIRGMIERKLDTSRSQYIEAYEKEIRHALARAKHQRRPKQISLFRAPR